MIKLTLSSIFLYLLIQPSMARDIIAKPQHCAGNAIIPSSFVDIVCTNGRCTGLIPIKKIRLRGACEMDAEFEADGTVPPISFFSYCQAGVISINTYSQSIPFYGECTQYNEYAGSFYSTTETLSAITTGFCQENGNSRIYFEGEIKSIVGRCR